jgi:hypothetical protein
MQRPHALQNWGKTTGLGFVRVVGVDMQLPFKTLA